ncbi:MAG: type III toxin-antitoxin system ToxN/AbiQ family toxin [Bacilli bacterium]|nr:type III toxin-antitoxin system ToxN/AbiQ family toxin [Bacilli bacterium]
MYKNFKIVKVDSNYCDYLRTFDNKVVYNRGIKELRPLLVFYL